MNEMPAMIGLRAAGIEWGIGRLRAIALRWASGRWWASGRRRTRAEE